MTDSLEPDDLYDLRRPGDVTVSPNGERVAFVTTEADPDEDEFRQSLFVAPADGHREPTRLTRLANAQSPTWGPDGDRLAFLATRETDVSLQVGSDDETDDDEDGDVEGGGNDGPKQQLWLFDLSVGGDARQLTDFEEGVREVDWSPAGDRLVVSAKDPSDEELEYLRGVRDDSNPYDVTRLQHKRDGVGYLDEVTSRLFVISDDARGVDRDEATRLEDATGRGAFESAVGLQPAWGPSDRIAYVAYYGAEPDRTYAMDIHVIDPDGTNRQTLTQSEITARGLRWSPSGDRLAYTAAHPTNFYHPDEIHVADLDTDDTRSVSASLDRTVGWSGTAEWIDEETLIAPIGDEARTRLFSLNANEDDPEPILPTQGTDRTIASMDANAETVAVVFSDPSDGHDVFAVETAAIDDNTDPTRLSSLNEELLDDTALPTCERIHFEQDDGVEIEGLVYLPPDNHPDDTGEPLPLICHIHGGPTAYDAPSFNFDYTYWTGKGYAVLNVNYRGSTSYGRSFSESIRGDWGPREAADILAGVDEAVEREWADPDRLFISGFSQGGINTLYVITRDDRFQAAAPEHGIYDFTSNFGPADMHQWYVNDMGVPWENEEGYRSISSIHDVDAIDTPLLITAGENDWRCPPSQAEQLYVSATREGVDTRLVMYQDEHHNISRPGRGIHRLETLTEWFESHDPDVDTASE